MQLAVQRSSHRTPDPRSFPRSFPTSDASLDAVDAALEASDVSVASVDLVSCTRKMWRNHGETMGRQDAETEISEMETFQDIVQKKCCRISRNGKNKSPAPLPYLPRNS